MTAPAGGAPDGAFVVGDRMGQDITEQSANAEMRAMPIDPWVIAQQVWQQACQKQRATLAELKDGQFALNGRIDLLEQVSGYGSSVMRYNWNVPYSRWIVLPFDVQLGPTKGVEIHSESVEEGYLLLKKGGLWRVDSHFTIQGMSMGVSWYVISGIIYPVYNYNPIFPIFRIEIFNGLGELLDAKQYHMVSDIALYAENALSQANQPRSGAFSHTFVLPEMPPEDDPDAPNHWARVQLSILYEPIYSGMISETNCTVKGGTQYSSLIATRWSPDVEALNYQSEVPDGGDLG